MYVLACHSYTEGGGEDGQGELLEVKNRVRRLFDRVVTYEKVQLHVSSYIRRPTRTTSATAAAATNNHAAKANPKSHNQHLQSVECYWEYAH